MSDEPTSMAELVDALVPIDPRMAWSVAVWVARLLEDFATIRDATEWHPGDIGRPQRCPPSPLAGSTRLQGQPG
jgi:hypothetical protein